MSDEVIYFRGMGVSSDANMIFVEVPSGGLYADNRHGDLEKGVLLKMVEKIEEDQE